MQPDVQDITEDDDPWIRGADVIRAVCAVMGVSRESLLSRRKNVRIVRARFIGYALCHELTRLSMVQIGKIFGNRDHSTICYGHKVAKRLLADDPDFARAYKSVKVAIRPSWSRQA